MNKPTIVTQPEPGQLRKVLEDLVAAQAHFKFPALIEQTVLKIGREFPGTKRPKGMRRKAVKECYSNSTRLFMQRTNYYRYVEGYVLPPYLQRPIAHAWVITPEDQVIDVTLQKPELYSYMGVVFDQRMFYDAMSGREVFGLFCNDFIVNTDLIFKLCPELKDQ